MQDIINSVIVVWARDFAAKTRSASQPLPNSTGGGKASIRTKVTPATLQSIAVVSLQFQDHLRFFDLKKLTHSKLPNVAELEKWVLQKGVGKFKTKASPRTGNVALANRIAWGIAISMKARGTWKQKRKRWYSKGNEAAINRLYSDLLDKLATSQLQNIAK